MDFYTATPAEILDKLKKLKKELEFSLKSLDALYKDFMKRSDISTETKNLLKYHYKNHGLSSIILSATKTISQIEKLTETTSGANVYLSRLVEIAEENREKDLGDFKHDWLDKIETEDYAPFYIALDNINDRITTCGQGSKELTKFKDFLFQENGISATEYWITKNKKGQYLFDGNILHIKSRSARYYIIFDVCFRLKPTGGNISYADIIEECGKRGKKETIKTIQTALTYNHPNATFFRHAKGVLQAPNGGINLFETDQKGESLIFNNKK